MLTFKVIWMLEYLNRNYSEFPQSTFALRGKGQREVAVRKRYILLGSNYEYDKFENSHFSYNTLVILTNMRDVLWLAAAGWSFLLCLNRTSVGTVPPQCASFMALKRRCIYRVLKKTNCYPDFRVTCCMLSLSLAVLVNKEHFPPTALHMLSCK